MKKETFSQLIRYGIAGVFNTLIGLAVVYVLQHYMDIRLANLMSFGVGMITNFYTSKTFTFKSKGNTQKQGSYFFVIYLFCFIVSFGILNLLLWQQTLITSLSVVARGLFPQGLIDLITTKRYEVVTSPKMIATYFMIVMFAVLNFSLNKYITFKKENRQG